METKLTNEEKRETFTGPDGREYFRHVPGDAMPCPRESMVTAVLRCGDYDTKPSPAAAYMWHRFTGLPSTEIIGWRYADEQPEPAKIPDPWKGEREALQARVKELEDALQGLVDWQNGCPLPTWETEYNKAMDAARKALNPHIPKVSPQ